MINIISWLLIIISLIIVLVIVFRKFPALALLDVHNIPGEKEAKFKDKIIKQKVERDLAVVSGTIGRLYLVVSRYVANFFQLSQARLKKLKISYQSSARIPQIEKQRMIKELLVEAEDLLSKEDFRAVEEKLLEAISLDQKNCLAFFRLANLYDEEKKWPEARQTYEHTLKLVKQAKKHNEESEGPVIQEIYFSLAEIEKENGDLGSALENIREALEYEPNSPRYLDLILDLSIMKKDKDLALVSLEKLAAVNPENKKLGEWQEKVENI